MKYKFLRNTVKTLAVIGFTLLTSSCSVNRGASDNSQENVSQTEYVNIEKDRKIELPFISFDNENEYRQILTSDYAGKKNSLLCIVKLGPSGINLTGLTLSSLPLFNLKYENGKLDGKYYVPKGMLPPVNQVLFDIMLSFDEKNRLNKTLTKEYIINRDDNSVALRRVDGKAIYSIEYALYDLRKLPVKIVNHEFNYSITLKYIQQ